MVDIRIRKVSELKICKIRNLVVRLKVIDLGHAMYQSFIPTRVCTTNVDSLFLKSCSLHNIKNGDSLLSENRVVFYFRN